MKCLLFTVVCAVVICLLSSCAQWDRNTFYQGYSRGARNFCIFTTVEMIFYMDDRGINTPEPEFDRLTEKCETTYWKIVKEENVRD